MRSYCDLSRVLAIEFGNSVYAIQDPFSVLIHDHFYRVACLCLLDSLSLMWKALWVIEYIHGACIEEHALPMN
jgi:hypothetical protein